MTAMSDFMKLLVNLFKQPNEIMVVLSENE